GAPLETPNGNVLGTICVIDHKPRVISERRRSALKLLAKKIMEYLNSRKMALEQIAFDISHVLRKPVTNMIGLTSLIIEEKHLTPGKIKKFVPLIKSVSEELDEFTRRLNKAYQIKKDGME
ncbi:MAG: hypothetical protein WD431_20585, partial [Cyclobacteriaceae bacterium]